MSGATQNKGAQFLGQRIGQDALTIAELVEQVAARDARIAELQAQVAAIEARRRSNKPRSRKSRQQGAYDAS
jgi:hypothetical protein